MKWHRFARNTLQGNDGHFMAWCAGRRERWGWRLRFAGHLLGEGETRTLREAVQAVEATRIDREKLEWQYAAWMEISRRLKPLYTGA